jgi:cytochrome c oxidase subunit II
MDRSVGMGRSAMTSSSAPAKAAVAVSSAAPASSAAAQMSVRKVSIEATYWAFTPNVVKIKKGEKIQLVVTSKDGIHGFAIPNMRINEHVDMHQTVTVDIPTDAVGTFEFRCSVPCGEGHREMTGQIVIE